MQMAQQGTSLNMFGGVSAPANGGKMDANALMSGASGMMGGPSMGSSGGSSGGSNTGSSGSMFNPSAMMGGGSAGGSSAGGSMFNPNAMISGAAPSGLGNTKSSGRRSGLTLPLNLQETSHFNVRATSQDKPAWSNFQFKPFDAQNFVSGDGHFSQSGSYIESFNPNTVMNADLGYTIITYDPKKALSGASFNPNMALSGASYDPNQNVKNYIKAYDPNSLRDTYMTGTHNLHAHEAQPYNTNGVMTSYDPNKLTTSYISNIFDPNQLNAKFTGSFDANSQPDSFVGDSAKNRTSTQLGGQGPSTEINHQVNTNWAGQWKGEWPSKHTSDMLVGDSVENRTSTQSEGQRPSTEVNLKVNTNWAGQWKGEWPSKHTSDSLSTEEKDSPDGETGKSSWTGSWSKSWPGEPASHGSIDQGDNTQSTKSPVTDLHSETNLEETAVILQELLKALKTRNEEKEF
ncbi:hypothetical protein KP79_PYT10584 [Mizuhopecten yessoensis]|uniref:Uncharacterized protein n=1 Tax=Mizuhopecten yessoensis TaxID=6573 RepID=A0A210PH01_MIZYE|nr:hypothetical protein KP79_PYT10584 [Mizuhopecten yessoensis]